MEGQNQISEDTNEPIDIFCKCFLGAIVLCTYIIGVFLHVKLIKASKKDKEMTWMMDICNSIFLLILFAHIIIMKTLTYLIENVQTYTGAWFCYTSKALTITFNAHVSGHTFIIAIMKYVMIVLHEKVRLIGKEKTQKIFLVINILYPVYLFSIFNLINFDFLFVYGAVSQANRCLGESELVSNMDSNKTAVRLHNLCEFSGSLDVWSFRNVLYLGRSIFCWFHVILVYLNLWNVIEAVVYYFVFKFMWR